jgi:hypothetical protein
LWNPDINPPRAFNDPRFDPCWLAQQREEAAELLGLNEKK